jgi:hypothetical protein
MDFHYLLQCSFTSCGESRELKEDDKIFRYNYPTHFRALQAQPIISADNHNVGINDNEKHVVGQPLLAWYSQQFSRNYAIWVKSFYIELHHVLPYGVIKKQGMTVLGHSSCTFRRIGMGGAVFPNCGSQYLKEPEECISSSCYRTCKQ